MFEYEFRRLCKVQLVIYFMTSETKRTNDKISMTCVHIPSLRPIGKTLARHRVRLPWLLPTQELSRSVWAVRTRSSSDRVWRTAKTVCSQYSIEVRSLTRLYWFPNTRRNHRNRTISRTIFPSETWPTRRTLKEQISAFLINLWTMATLN